MPQKTPIEWSDYSSNPLYVTRKRDGKRGWHCVHKSDGCRRCYSETLNKRFGTGFDYKAGHVKDLDFHLNEKELFEIIKLSERLGKRGETAKCFVGDMTDIFLDEYTDEMLDKLWATFALSPNITFQVLTKRAERMREWFAEQWQPAPAQTFGRFHLPAETVGENRRSQVSRAVDDLVTDLKLVDFDSDDSWTPEGNLKVLQFPWPLPNVWLGVSCEDQKTADERIPLLLQTPAAVRFVSAEPLLGPINLDNRFDSFLRHQEPYCSQGRCKEGPGLSWVICGGESGAQARPCDIDWIRSIIEQCKAANVPCFVKQLGSDPRWHNSWDGQPISEDQTDRIKATLRFAGHTEQAISDALANPKTLPRLRLTSRKGNDMDEWPLDLRVRQMPEVGDW